MDSPKLGELITGDSYKDAIHIAIAPVIAGERLFPGQHVGFVSETEVGSKAKELIGIVDPFIKHFIEPGLKFYLFLYPNTITSLRHDWSHPAFNVDVKEWLLSFAKKLGHGYQTLIDIADTYYAEGTYCFDNSEKYKDISSKDWQTFWKHYETLTGNKVSDHEAVPFYCSC